MFRKRIHVVSEKSPGGQWRPCRTCPLQQDAITSILQVAHNRTDLKIFYWQANWKYQHRSIAARRPPSNMAPGWHSTDPCRSRMDPPPPPPLPLIWLHGSQRGVEDP